MRHDDLDQSAEYTRRKMIESYDIETRAREKDRDAAKEVPGIPQNIPDFAPYAGKNGQEGDKTG